MEDSLLVNWLQASKILPIFATLATIVSYFSAEVTQGIWAYMNGTDWPSPAAMDR